MGQTRAIIQRYLQIEQNIAQVKPPPPSKSEAYELIKTWLEGSKSEWFQVLERKCHVKYSDYEDHTDAMARWIVEDAYDEITR